MGKTFRKVVLCSTDDFPTSKNDKIRGWVENNGGKFTKELTPDVTHLVASKSACKKNIPIVRAARHQRNVKIVKLEWLEDSLLSKSRKPLPTEKYDREREHWRKRRVEKARSQGLKPTELAVTNGVIRNGDEDAKGESIEEAGKAFDRACEEFEVKMKAAGFHLYVDPMFFTYSVNLVRSDILANRLEKHRLKVRYAPSFCPFSSPFSTPPCPLPLFHFPSPYPFSSYPTVSARLPRHLRPSNHNHTLRIRIPDPWANCLQLYESNKTPHTYAAVTSHLNRTGRVNHLTVAPKGSSFELARDCFKGYFKLRTGIEWESRPRGILCKSEESSGREWGLSQDGAGDFVYLPDQDEVSKEVTRRSSVTVVVSEEDAGSKIDVRAKTPETGW